MTPPKEVLTTTGFIAFVGMLWLQYAEYPLLSIFCGVVALTCYGILAYRKIREWTKLRD